MLVAAIEVLPGETGPIQDWLDQHSTITVNSITFSGNYCYIFYTEAQ